MFGNGPDLAQRQRTCDTDPATFAALSEVMRRMRTCSLLVAAILAVSALAQGSNTGGPFYPEKLHSDLEVLRDVLHRAHPDPYRYATQAGLDRAFDEVRDSITVPMDRQAFLNALMPVFHLVGDAHCYPDLPATQRGRIEQELPVIPIKVSILNEGLYVEEELKGFRSLPLGVRILSINGHSAEHILQRLGRMITVDGANTTLRVRRLEKEFPWLYRRYIDASSSFTVRYQMTDGSEAEQKVFAMTGEEMARTRKPDGAGLNSWRVFWDQDSEALWVTLRTLDLDTLAAAGIRPDRFLAAMLKDARRNKARSVVFDLRGAGGRDLAAAELVFASVAKAPFRVVQSMTVRSIDPALGPLAGLPADHLSMVLDQFVPGPNGVSHLRPDDTRLVPLQPMAKAFQGKVYVVCDGMTRDAGAALVMLAKRTGRARVVGEEVGSNALSFTGGRALTTVLPHSGIELHVPLMRYVPDGMPSGPMDHGERPHHEVEQQPWGIAKGRDTIREALLEMIRELR